MSEPIDNLAVLVADIDQYIMHVPHMMRSCMAIKTGALEEGFTEEEAQLMANQMYQRFIA